MIHQSEQEVKRSKFSLNLELPKVSISETSQNRDGLNTKYLEIHKTAEDFLAREAEYGLLRKIDTSYSRLFESKLQGFFRKIRENFVPPKNIFQDESSLKSERELWLVYKQILSEFCSQSLERATGEELDQLRVQFNELYRMAFEQMMTALQKDDLSAFNIYSQFCQKLYSAKERALYKNPEFHQQGTSPVLKRGMPYWYGVLDEKIEEANHPETTDANPAANMVVMGEDFLDFLGKNDLKPQPVTSFSQTANVILPKYHAMAVIKADEKKLIIHQPTNPHRTGMGIKDSPITIQITDSLNLEAIPVDSIFANEDEAAGTPYSQRLKEIFNKLNQAGKEKVETHSLDYYFLPDAIAKGAWSLDFRGGFQTEAVPTAEGQHRNKYGVNTPIKSDYVEPSHWSGILLIDHDKIEKEYPLKTNQEKGFRLLKKLEFKDPALLYVLVDDTLRKSLLQWISSWPEQRRLSIFGNRNPENLFISNVSQMKE